MWFTKQSHFKSGSGSSIGSGSATRLISATHNMSQNTSMRGDTRSYAAPAGGRHCIGSFFGFK